MRNDRHVSEDASEREQDAVVPGERPDLFRRPSAARRHRVHRRCRLTRFILRQRVCWPLRHVCYESCSHSRYLVSDMALGVARAASGVQPDAFAQETCAPQYAVTSSGSPRIVRNSRGGGPPWPLLKLQAVIRVRGTAWYSAHTSCFSSPTSFSPSEQPWRLLRLRSSCIRPSRSPSRSSVRPSAETRCDRATQLGRERMLSDLSALPCSPILFTLPCVVSHLPRIQDSGSAMERSQVTSHSSSKVYASLPYLRLTRRTETVWQ